MLNFLVSGNVDVFCFLDVFDAGHATNDGLPGLCQVFLDETYFFDKWLLCLESSEWLSVENPTFDPASLPST